MIETQEPSPLLGGLSPQQFMKRHWQRKPLLVRQALPGFQPLLSRGELVDLAGQEGVESRLVVQHPERAPGWTLKHGPFARRSLPPFKQPGWTVLVQGVDLHHAGAHELMNRFRFVPDARLDDLMISYATDGGGVGPHFDSYDVFLIQAHGKRLWRIGRNKNKQLQEGVPLKILTHFEPEQEHVLEPGDMLYLPPGWAHDGIAQGECMTYSVGFRIPNRADLARELLQHLADDVEERVGTTLYKDPQQPATPQPALIPAAMLTFAQEAVQEALSDAKALARGLGEALTEPKANVWFEALQQPVVLPASVVLNRRSRMMYDEHHVFINGESFRAAGRDAQLMRQLADTKTLDAAQVRLLSAQAKSLLREWVGSGWVDLAARPTDARIG